MDRELFRETEWSKIYGTSAAHLHWESKFLDPSFTVSFASIRERWAELDNIARLDFSVAFSAKAWLSEEDMSIVEFLMDVADANVCSNIAGMVAMLKDKQKAALLLTTKIDSSPGPLSNYFQALGQLGEQIT